jgi:hypothetical protein
MLEMVETDTQLQEIELVKVSFFCEKNKLPILAAELLDGLIGRLYKCGKISNHFLFISCETNEHIRLILWSTTSNIAHVRRFCKHHMRMWFRDHKSPKLKFDKYALQLWMKPSNNSFHFNLFETPIYATKYSIFYNYSDYLTEQLLVFLRDNHNFDAEDLITNCLLLGVVLVMHGTENLINNIEQAANILNMHFEIEQGGLPVHSVIEDFSHNSDFLQEHFNAVKYAIDSLDENLKIWHDKISTVVENIKDTDQSDAHIINMLSLVNYAHGLGPAKQFYVLVFLLQLLKINAGTVG